MLTTHHFSRREFLAAAAGGTAAALIAKPKRQIPVGLMLFAVREALERDLPGTLRAVAQTGFEGVEFFGPYFDWSPAVAKQIRTQLDGLGMRCRSTHNEAPAFTPEGISHAIELNQILGSPNIVCVRGLASPRPGAKAAAKGFEGEGLDGWKGSQGGSNRVHRAISRTHASAPVYGFTERCKRTPAAGRQGHRAMETNLHRGRTFGRRSVLSHPARGK